MAQVIVRENESLESALKRFKRSCARDGVMSELRKREHYGEISVMLSFPKRRVNNFPDWLYNQSNTFPVLPPPTKFSVLNILISSFFNL